MHDYFLVNHGKSGVLGSFAAPEPLPLRRGDRVVVQSLRGLEVGTVLGPASVRQSRQLGSQSSGALMRLLSPEDRGMLQRLQALEQGLFTAARQLAAELTPTLVVLDAELLFDGRHALLQTLGGDDLDVADFIARLRTACDVDVKLENLAVGHENDEHHEGGCGKPDCGRSEGGCSNCGSGGCSSCGSSGVDLRPYFAHLRGAIEEAHRTPLL
jgi:hypothetical protein